MPSVVKRQLSSELTHQKKRPILLQHLSLYYSLSYITALSGTYKGVIIHLCRPKLEDISRNITNILNKLVNPATYDKRLRPNYGGKCSIQMSHFSANLWLLYASTVIQVTFYSAGAPVDVGITIHVSSISAVSEVAMV